MLVARELSPEPVTLEPFPFESSAEYVARVNRPIRDDLLDELISEVITARPGLVIVGPPPMARVWPDCVVTRCGTDGPFVVNEHRRWRASAVRQRRISTSKDGEQDMAKGKKCPECKNSMYAQTEKYEPKGTWVTYVCRIGSCPSVKRGYPASERLFEGS